MRPQSIKLFSTRVSVTPFSKEKVGVFVRRMEHWVVPAVGRRRRGSGNIVVQQQQIAKLEPIFETVNENEEEDEEEADDDVVVRSREEKEPLRLKFRIGTVELPEQLRKASKHLLKSELKATLLISCRKFERRTAKRRDSSFRNAKEENYDTRSEEDDGGNKLYISFRVTNNHCLYRRQEPCICCS
jgi:hypothetical protein